MANRFGMPALAPVERRLPVTARCVTVQRLAQAEKVRLNGTMRILPCLAPVRQASGGHLGGEDEAAPPLGLAETVHRRG